MLLQEKIQTISFSSNEQLVLDFISSKQYQIEFYSTTKIAEETYTSPSVLVRIAKKLGFNGRTEFKRAYLEEIRFLRSNFQDLDANKPFVKDDSFQDIAGKLAQLKKESLADRLSLINPEQLEQATLLLKQQKNIQVFALSNLLFLGEEFVFKLRHIQKSAKIFTIQNTMYQEAAMSSHQNYDISEATSESSAVQETSSTEDSSNSLSLVSINLENHFLADNSSIKLSTPNQLLYSTSDSYADTTFLIETQLDKLDIEDTRIVENEESESLVVTTYFEG